MNILLVDDEIIAVNGLRASVNWKNLGIEQVYYAFCVADAKNIIQSNDIHILICDIEMPEENGLDLLKWIRMEHYPIVSILLTCHANFSYATEGIKSGVLEYLLKPVDIDNLELTIKKAIGEVRKNLDYHQRLKQDRLLSNNKNLIQERFWYDIVTGMYQNSDYTYIEWNADLHSVELPSLITYLPIMISVVSYENFLKEEALLSYSIKNVISELILENEASIPPISLSKVYYLALIAWNSDKSLSYIEKRCQNLELSCHKHLNLQVQITKGLPVPFSKLADEVASLQQSTHILLTKETPSIPKVTVVDKIKEIIHQNVNQIITREYIGNLIFLNPDYLSKLFKKETGQSLSDYIIKVKIEESKRQLRNTDKNIGEITVDLGYTNFSYFSKMFKQETGLTPLQYRQSYRQTT